MSCIHCHSPFLLLQSQVLKNKQQLKTAKLLWLSSNEPSKLLQRPNRPLLPPLRSNPVTTSLVLGVTSPAKSGDVSVFLQLSAVLLFAYWITNFVVPDIIFKYLQLDKTSGGDDDEDEKPSDNNPLEDEKTSAPMSGVRRSQPKKRGFNSTKQ